MNKLSQRHIVAAVAEKSRAGIGVSTAARKYARKYYTSWGWKDMASMRNADLNEILAQDFMRGELKHKFKLRDGSMAEIRKSNTMYYVAKIRSDGGYDILVIQGSYKPPKKEKKWKPGII